MFIIRPTTGSKKLRLLLAYDRRRSIRDFRSGMTSFLHVRYASRNHGVWPSDSWNLSQWIS